jgi:hypothetical protein
MRKNDVMKKIILWSIVSLVIAGVAVDAFLWLRRPQVIQLDKNTQLTLLGVDYGRHHKYPVVKPKPGARRSNYGGPGSFDTPNPTLVVWILQQHKANQWPNYQVLTYDRAETACVENWTRNSRRISDTEDIAGVQFDAYPRWDRKMILRIMWWGNSGERIAKDRFVISNPARNSGTRWTPEPLPDTQSDGDLSVTLTKFVYGVRGFRGGNGLSASDPMNKAVLTVFHTVQNGVVVTNWQPIRIETSDSTGNKIQNNSWSTGRDENGDVRMTYQWGLWPEKTPWKLRVEMSQTSGFKSDQLWTVQGVPVNPGSQQDLWNYGGRDSRTPAPFAETTLDGIHLKLFPVIQFTNQYAGNNERPGGFRVQADQNLDGMQLTLVSATDENGHEVPYWGGNGWGGDSRQIQLRNLRNAKSLILTLALHKSRFVEFTVKPAKP